MKTLYRMRDINRTQRGFTLIELLIAIAITALVGSAVATGVYQIVKVNASSTNRQVAIAQVQNATNSISRDAQQAQQIFPASANFLSGESLTLQWTTWDNHFHVVTYDLLGTSLRRTITIDSGAPSTTIVANSITAASVKWYTAMKVLDFTVLTATVGTGPAQRSETRTFQINPRSAQ